MQLALTSRSARGLAMNAQYTLGYSKGNTGGSNEARTAGNNARDARGLRLRLRLQQLRRPAHLQPERALHGSRQGRAGAAAGASAASSTPAAACRSTCSSPGPTSSMSTARGTVWNTPAADRDGGHQHAGRRLVAQHAAAGPRPGRDPVHQGRRAAVPEPGGVRDAAAGHVRQPGTQLDPRAELPADRLVVAKRIAMGGGSNLELRSEFFNIFNITNFAYDGSPHAAERAAGRG